jgi:hypothetical protein
MNSDELERIRAVKEAHETALLQKPNVVGVGIGMRMQGGQMTDELGIVVSVTKKIPLDGLDPTDVIPSELEGVPVDIQEVGTLHPL